MITDPVELSVQRDLTRAFIAADHHMLSLVPQIEDKTGTGGRTWRDGDPRDPQPFHIIERNSTAKTLTRVPGGEASDEEFTLLGNWDAMIAVKDHFSFGGGHWEIAKVQYENGYERRASVIRYGR